MTIKLVHQRNDIKLQIKNLEKEIIDDIGSSNFKAVTQHAHDKYLLLSLMVHAKEKTFITTSYLNSLSFYNKQWIDMRYDYIVDDLLRDIDNRLEVIQTEMVKLLGSSYEKFMHELPRLNADKNAIKIKLNGTYGILTS